jgi:hypothetical protein
LSVPRILFDIQNFLKPLKTDSSEISFNSISIHCQAELQISFLWLLWVSVGSLRIAATSLTDDIVDIQMVF